MEMKLLGLTFRLEVVLICVALAWILGGHLLCSCMRVTPYEGFQSIRSSVENMVTNAAALDYKMSAGIEVKKKAAEEVTGFIEDFKRDHESVKYEGSCGTK